MVELNVKLGPKGQIVIPKLLRDQFNMQLGEEIRIKETPQGILITPIEYDIIETFERIADKATAYRKGKPFVYDKKEVYKDIEKRAKRAGIR